MTAGVSRSTTGTRINRPDFQRAHLHSPLNTENSQYAHSLSGSSSDSSAHPLSRECTPNQVLLLKGPLPPTTPACMCRKVIGRPLTRVDDVFHDKHILSLQRSKIAAGYLHAARGVDTVVRFYLRGDEAKKGANAAASPRRKREPYRDRGTGNDVISFGNHVTVPWRPESGSTRTSQTSKSVGFSLAALFLLLL